LIKHLQTWREELKARIMEGDLTPNWYARVIATVKQNDNWGIIGWNANKRLTWLVILAQ
jgi:hypothetical protein